MGATGAPATLDLSKAAEYLLVCRADADADGKQVPLQTSDHAAGAYWAALDLWEALTGLTGDPALAYAEQCRTKPTTAVIPPF